MGGKNGFTLPVILDMAENHTDAHHRKFSLKEL